MGTRRRFLAGGVAGALAGCLGLQDRDPDLRGEWTQVGKTATNASHASDVTLPESLGDAVLTVARGGEAFRREEPRLGSRELFELPGETTTFTDDSSGVVGADRLFAIDGVHGVLSAFRPEG